MNRMDRCYEIFGWRFTLTPVRLVFFALFMLAALVIAVRLFTGFGYVTHLTDETPWGLWIGFDVMTGVALAGGGYSTALLVGGFHYRKYSVVTRSALLTSLLGYLLVMAGLFLDIGQWFNFWRPFVFWGYHSVLFEVFWCISTYTTILSLEFYEIITERIFKRTHKLILRAIPLLVILGLIFPIMHQSSLGGLFLIMKDSMYPLWWSPFLPLYFLISSFFVGSAMVYCESDLSRRAFGHCVDSLVMKSLTRTGASAMLFYLALKIFDLTRYELWGTLFNGSLQSNMYLLEIGVGVLAPLIIHFTPLVDKKNGLLVYAWLVVAGLVFNRLNCVFTSLYKLGNYFPSIFEIAVTVGLCAAGCLLYCFLVENFNILGGEHAHQVHIDAKNTHIIGEE